MAEKHITMLLYHQIDPDSFSAHLEYMKKEHYNIISLRDIRDAFLLVRPKALPPRSLVITFDDGWKSNYSLLPVLQEYNCPVTIFLPVGIVGTNRKIWNYALDQSSYQENNWLKTLSNEEKDRYLKQKYGHYPKREYEKRSVLNIAEIKEMKSRVDFQSHSMFHPVLTMCSKKELAFETVKSREILSKITGSEVYAIAYPYGRVGKREKEAARAAGYQLGRTAANHGLNWPHVDEMALRAIGVGSTGTLKELKKNIAWAHLRMLIHPRHKVPYSQTVARSIE
jgi:peptidoglycan/xylan/chitin deacetylase (PgdA/CDA1 family)